MCGPSHSENAVLRRAARGEAGESGGRGGTGAAPPGTSGRCGSRSSAARCPAWGRAELPDGSGHPAPPRLALGAVSGSALYPGSRLIARRAGETPGPAGRPRAGEAAGGLGRGRRGRRPAGGERRSPRPSRDLRPGPGSGRVPVAAPALPAPQRGWTRGRVALGRAPPLRDTSGTARSLPAALGDTWAVPQSPPGGHPAPGVTLAGGSGLRLSAGSSGRGHRRPQRPAFPAAASKRAHASTGARERLTAPRPPLRALACGPGLPARLGSARGPRTAAPCPPQPAPGPSPAAASLRSPRSAAR